MLQPTERFSSRVADYVRYRPLYPPEVLDLLVRECGVSPSWIVADIGAGPGNLTRLFLDHGNTVYAIEPNRDMREAGERLLSDRNGYRSVDGSAEATGLESGSVDLVVAGQAFHWFDRAKSRTEFNRILRGEQWVALVWNVRRSNTTEFLRSYEELLSQLPEYQAIHAEREPIDDFRSFFSSDPRKASFQNEQGMDRASFLGRVLSSSYIPQEGMPGHEPLMSALGRLFDKHQEGGTVTFQYDTEVYYSRLAI